MKIGIFYFSATGVTHRIAQEIRDTLRHLDHDVDLLNILYPWNQSEEISYAKYDGCFFGFPVYGGRLPSIAENWLAKQKGQNTPCAMFFTYGGCSLEQANQITAYLLILVNFRVVLSSEYLGKHTFNVAEGWELCTDRPNERDFHVVKKFSEKSIQLFNNSEWRFQINLDDFTYTSPKLDLKKEKGAFNPSRGEKICSMCRKCEEECPTQAMDADSGEADPVKCLKCMHCVTICPDNVLFIADATEGFPKFMKRINLTQELVKNKKSIFYSRFPEKTD